MLRRQWVQDRDGFLLVYSMTDKRSFDELDHFLSLIKSIKAGKQVPLVIVANKSDLKVHCSHVQHKYSVRYLGPKGGL